MGGGVHIGSTRHVGHYWPNVHTPRDCDDEGESGGMKIGRGTEVLGENLPQSHFVHTTNPTCQTRARTWAAAVGS
jgi:hypothetical protein